MKEIKVGKFGEKKRKKKEEKKEREKRKKGNSSTAAKDYGRVNYGHMEKQFPSCVYYQSYCEVVSSGLRTGRRISTGIARYRCRAQVCYMGAMQFHPKALVIFVIRG